MLPSLIITAFAIFGGLLLTYLYDDESPLPARLCAGACIGLSVLGLMAFVLASFGGFTRSVILLSTAIASLPIALLRRDDVRKSCEGDLRVFIDWSKRVARKPSGRQIFTLIFFAAFVILMWFVFDRVMFEKGGNIFTGELNNYGDLPFHIGVITSFAKGNNFPPEDPTFSGIRFTYPFVSDLVAAIYVRFGASIKDSIFLENLILSFSTVALLYRFGLVVTKDRLAGIFTTLLVLFSGGVGWMKIFRDIEISGKGVLGTLMALPGHEYSIVPNTIFRWGNTINSLLFTQRSILMGIPLALIVFTEWWKIAFREALVSTETAEIPGKPSIGQRKKNEVAEPPEPVLTEIENQRDAFWPPNTPVKRMFVLGCIAGMLPLIHAHTFAVILMVGFFLGLFGGIKRWPRWISFFVGAALTGAPTLIWAALGSTIRTNQFVGMEFGWDHVQNNIHYNIAWFWLVNTGVFIPLLIAAFAWRGEKPLLSRALVLFYLPFMLCFIVPNVFKLAPWIWDNIKVLIYWWIASAPIVGMVLARLWRKGLVERIAAGALLASLTLSGALDVWKIASKQAGFQEFDKEGIELAKLIEDRTPPNALILHGTAHNHPAFLTGRRSLMGYPGHVWSHGLDPEKRHQLIRVMYAGGYDAKRLILENNISYIVVSNLENQEMNVNNAFFEQNFTRIGQIRDYRLYKVNP